MGVTFTSDEKKIIGLSGPTFVRMLQAKEDQVIKRIIADYVNGKTEFLALIAELHIVRSLIEDIKHSLREQS